MTVAARPNGGRRLVGLALDLHDGPLQDLAALRFDLDLFRGQLLDVLQAPDEHRSGRIVGRLDDLAARLESAEAELRRLASLAGSAVLLEGEFGPMLRRIVEEHAHGLDVPVVVDEEIEGARLDDDLRVAVLRSVQAALANVVQHSGAGCAYVIARCTDGELVVEVADAGCGFDVGEAESRAFESGRLGLFGMRERVHELHGALTVRSGDGSGTTVSIRVPLR